MRWTQEAKGEIDVSGKVADAFADAGTTRPGLCSSYTGQGLVRDWPDAGTEIGDGWRVSRKKLTRVDGIRFPAEGKLANTASDYSKIYFPLWSIEPDMRVAYDAARDRTETVSFTVAAGMQPLITEASEGDTVAISLRSAAAAETIDGSRPIGDVRRRSYFQTDRGAESIQHLILRARARLLAEARAVEVLAEIPFETAIGLSCRHSATLADDRLPGGTATGKVVGYKFGLDGQKGALYGDVTFAATIGAGGTLSTAAAVPAYVESGYVLAGWQAFDGGDAALPTGDVAYQYDTTAIADDGIEFSRFSADEAVISCTVANGQTAQAAVLDQSHADAAAAMVALNEVETRPTLTMRPVDGLTFQTDYSLTVSDLVIPKTIDLEAA